MEFGVQFLPDVAPAERSAEQYWADALYLSELGEELGFTSIRTVEHYFRPYGGYSPNPLLFLTAAAMVTKKARLISGAVLPAFNHPLKLAGEIGMLDAISHGRLEVGFARAFLPHEFAQFRVPLDESLTTSRLCLAQPKYPDRPFGLPLWPLPQASNAPAASVKTSWLFRWLVARWLI